MAAGGNNICGSQNGAALLINEKLQCSSELLDSFWLPKSSHSLQGPKSMANVERRPFESIDKGGKAYEDFDGGFNPPGKKRRLTASQVQFLEKNFDMENKLEPERKFELAKEIGLQPRQVAIWFQNRRARSKNQRLEKDYDSLKAVFDKLRDDYDSLLKEKQVLQNEVLLLKDKLLAKEKGKENLQTSDAIKLLDSEPQKLSTNTETKTKTESCVPMEICKQEDANSAKSDVFDSGSPHYTGNHSSLIDPADSSQDEDDNHSNGLLPPPYFLKLEDCCYPPTFGFSMEHQPFWSWP